MRVEFRQRPQRVVLFSVHLGRGKTRRLAFQSGCPAVSGQNVAISFGVDDGGLLQPLIQRMYHFEALDDVVSSLDRLSQRQPPLVAILPRQPGTKESRYRHLFSGDAPATPDVDLARASSRALDQANPAADRFSELENEVAELRREVAEIQQQLSTFRKQFE